MEKRPNFLFKRTKLTDAEIGVHVENPDGISLEFEDSELARNGTNILIGKKEKKDSYFLNITKHPIVSTVIGGLILSVIVLVIYFISGVDVNNPASAEPEGKVATPTEPDCSTTAGSYFGSGTRVNITGGLFYAVGRQAICTGDNALVNSTGTTIVSVPYNKKDEK